MHNLALDQIVLFGDSITQFGSNASLEGWAATLADKYMRKLDVVNRGFSGYNTEWAKHILSPILRSVTPTGSSIRLVVIFFGANDAVLPSSPQQHVPIARYQKNLRELISIVREFSPHTQVLLVAPPPVHEAKWAAECESQGRTLNRTVENTRIYRDACLSVAAECGVGKLDPWSAFFGEGAVYDADRAAAALVDGVHLSAMGNKLLGEALLKEIASTWRELQPQALPTLLPVWQEVTTVPASLFQDLPTM
ncbi:isoamyl acetate-hydrolyzing esterase [Gaertneriomyces sp. JEL0708]|nr:isoamyl acetate-hydrolyzing esterase [Gaertneriomyces sp. JEL0708]